MTKECSAGSAHGKPDYQEVEIKDLSDSPFPVPVRMEFRIYFMEDAYHEMASHAKTTSEVELGGVLVGDVLCDALGPYLKIVGSIPAEAAKNRQAQMTFTHESWDHINRVRDAKFPNHTLVGWYHTHPGFGIFLSEMDAFIQENFFNQPFQIAVVIDPKSKQEGCFVWEYGKPTPIGRYWVGSREIPLQSSGPHDNNECLSNVIAPDKSSTVRGKSLFLLIMIPSVIQILILFTIGYALVKTNATLSLQQKMLYAIMGNAEHSDAAAVINHETISGELSAIKDALMKNNTTSEDDRAATTEKLAAIMEALERVESEVLSEQKALSSELVGIKSDLKKISKDSENNQISVNEILRSISAALLDNNSEVIDRLRSIAENLGLLSDPDTDGIENNTADESILESPPGSETEDSHNE